MPQFTWKVDQNLHVKNFAANQLAALRLHSQDTLIYIAEIWVNNNINVVILILNMAAQAKFAKILEGKKTCSY